MSRLSTLINPWHAAEQGMHLGGAVEFSQLPRMLDVLAGPSGEIQCELEFFLNSQRRHCVQGRVWGKLWLVCQRCLKPVEVLVDEPLLLMLVKEQDSASLSATAHELLIVTGTHIRPIDIVEDEILLALPYIPLHNAGDKTCVIQELGRHTVVEEQLRTPGTEEHPFQILVQIKDQLH